MKFFDIIHEEGTFNIISDNELISVNITGIHPELILEDNSMLIFDSTETYYKFISNANLYTASDNDINLEELMAENFIDSDTVSNFSYKNQDVQSIFKFEYESNNIYYIQRTGINRLAE